jgi:hypothetical protein
MHIKENFVDNDVEDLILEGIVNKPKDATWLKLFDYCMEDLWWDKPPNIDKEREVCHIHIWRDYFFETPMYDERFFKWHHIKRKELFLKVMNVVVSYDDYFVQKKDDILRS